MKIFSTMIEGFNRVLFGDRNSTLKHICLFALTAIVSYSSVQSDIVKTQVKQVSGAMPNVTGVLLGVLAALIVGCYLFGYCLSFMNNIYHEKEEGVLPEFDENPFKIFFRAFPVLFVWAVYFILLCIGCTFCVIVPITIPLAFIGLFVIFLMSVFLQFAWVDFSRYFDRTGLYNIALPFKYMKSAFVPVLKLGLLYILVYILCMIPCILVGAILGIFGAGETATMYVGGILGGYLGFVCQLVWYYCIVKLYKEKFEFS